MHRITDSIEIALPPEQVFAFLRKIEPRMRLSPMYKVIRFEKLTRGDIGVGTRFRIVLLSNDIKSEYESEVVELAENERIVTRDTEGRLKLTLTLKETLGGTLLIHDEEFIIPDDIIYLEEYRKRPYIIRLLLSLIGIDRIRMNEREKEKRIVEIEDNLKKNLTILLGRIKETLEAGRV